MSFRGLNRTFNVDNYPNRYESIDFDFYDSNFSDNYNDSGCEEMSEGVNKVNISKIKKLSSNVNSSSESDKDLKCNISVADNNYDSDLTKCIAFENRQLKNGEMEIISKSSSEEETDTSSSLAISTTTESSINPCTSPSELTNVTPFSSSSSCCSFKDKNDNHSYDNDCEEEINDMKLLRDSFETLSMNKKINRSPTHSIKSKASNRPRRKNMTFTNEELRKIDRENEILLKKIMSYTKPRPKTIAFMNNRPPLSVKASSAVNRTKQQRQINHDNYILLKKIHNVKSTQSLINKS